MRTRRLTARQRIAQLRQRYRLFWPSSTCEEGPLVDEAVYRQQWQPDFAQIIARIRADQAAPVPDDAEPYVVLCHPVPQDPETQAALAELARAAIKAAKEGKLARRNAPETH